MFVTFDIKRVPLTKFVVIFIICSLVCLASAFHKLSLIDVWPPLCTCTKSVLKSAALSSNLHHSKIFQRPAMLMILMMYY